MLHFLVRSGRTSDWVRSESHTSRVTGGWIADDDNTQPNRWMKINDAVLRKLVNVWPVARLATTSEIGVPHVVPIVFVVEATILYSPIDGKLKRGTLLKRLSNVVENSRVSLLLDDYLDDWQRLWWVRLDGKAKVYVPDATKASEIEIQLLQKYPQYEDRTLLPHDVQYLRIAWHQGAAWAQSGDPEDMIQQAISLLGKGRRGGSSQGG